MKLLYTLGFLTRIRIPEKLTGGKENADPDYPGLLWYFPVTGLILGFINFLVFFVFNSIFPLIFSSVIVVIFEILLTGGLHYDGLSDTFDGYFSKEKQPEKVLEIMKKSNTGVFGVLAIIISVILKISLIYLLMDELHIARIFDIVNGNLKIQDAGTALPGFVVIFLIYLFVPAGGRLSMNYLFAKYPPAVRGGSLVLLFKDKDRNRRVFKVLMPVYSFIFVLFFAFSKYYFINHNIMPGAGSAGEFHGRFLLPGILPIFLAENILILLILSLSIIATSNFLVKRVQGICGDIMGAVGVISEIYFLFFLYLFFIISRLYTNNLFGALQ
jgi:cobalamin synthase